MSYKGTTFAQPAGMSQLSPGRYLVSFLIKNYPGTSGVGDAGQPENLGWIPLISTWHTTGKTNIERALSAKGIYAKAVEVRNMEWGPARRGGTLDIFGLSPWVQDFSFDIIIDLEGAVQGGGLQGFQRTGDRSFSGQLGALPVLAWVGIVALLTALGGVVATMFGAGDAYVTFIQKIAETAARAVGSVFSGAISGAASGVGLPVILLLGGVAAIWIMKSPKGRALKAAAWG